MDFLVAEEIKALKGDQAGAQEALEADKCSFQHKLMGDMGKQMMEELEHPSKKSRVVAWKYKIARWKTIRDNKKQERKRIKEIKKGGE